MTRSVGSIHDQTFRALMSNYDFAVGFYRAYLPREVLQRVDFNTLEILNVSGSVVGEKDRRSSQADIVHQVRLKNKKVILWTHIEHQSRAERFMPLRLTHYQCGQLLDYAKLNKVSSLPPIITVLYHQGRKPYSYSVKLEELFSEPELALKYFSRPILVDLPDMDDEVLSRHEGIGPAELILKYIRSKSISQKYRGLIAGIRDLDDKTRYSLLYYLARAADVDKRKLIEAVQEFSPDDMEAIMSPAEQWKAEGVEQGIQRGMQQGMQQGVKLAAKNMLQTGRYQKEEIMDVTGLSLDALDALR